MPTLLRKFPPYALALAVSSLCVSGPAFAFSQIVEDGAARTREGIVAVPLPPLPGTHVGPGPVEADGETLTPPEVEGEEDAEGAGTVDAPAPPLAPVPPSTTAAGEPGAAAGAEEQPANAAEPRPAEAAAPVGTDAAADGESTSSIETPRAPGRSDYASDGAAPSGQAPVTIAYGTDDLPRPVADLRTRLIEIARSGDIEQLRPYLDQGEQETVLSFGGAVGDPIAYLKEAAGDPEGLEILAILIDLLETGHVHLEAGGDNEIYVWPYFTQTRIDTLTNPQLVELFSIVTAGDYESMLDFGAYNFYRLGITPEGRLAFFLTGD